jgi:hypothetical protein
MDDGFERQTPSAGRHSAAEWDRSGLGDFTKRLKPSTTLDGSGNALGQE